MHELSIAQSIISIVENSLPKDFSGKIITINLNIGSLSGIEIDALNFAFSIIKTNSSLKDAELSIETIKGIAKCTECETQIEMNEFGNPCPSCGGYSMEIIQGKEMKIINIKVED